MTELSEAAKKARREYIREWRRKNPGKTAEYSARHWERIAAREAAAEAEKAGNADDSDPEEARQS